MELLAPREYWEASPELLARVCNGCGPGGWRLDLIPDRILGLVIKPACQIHDFMYYLGRNRLEADLYFLFNMVILACQASKWLLPLRLPVICWYFLGVYSCGGLFFGSS